MKLRLFCLFLSTLLISTSALAEPAVSSNIQTPGTGGAAESVRPSKERPHPRKPTHRNTRRNVQPGQHGQGNTASSTPEGQKNQAPQMDGRTPGKDTSVTAAERHRLQRAERHKSKTWSARRKLQQTDDSDAHIKTDAPGSDQP